MWQANKILERMYKLWKFNQNNKNPFVQGKLIVNAVVVLINIVHLGTWKTAGYVGEYTKITALQPLTVNGILALHLANLQIALWPKWAFCNKLI